MDKYIIMLTNEWGSYSCHKRLDVFLLLVFKISSQRKMKKMKIFLNILLIIIISAQFSCANELSFSSDYYIIYENQAFLEMSVIRQSSYPSAVTVQFQITGTTATPYSDYTPVNGHLSFAEGEKKKVITLPIIDNNVAELFETALVKLFQPSSDASLAMPYEATILFMDDEQTFQWQAPSFPNDTINDLWQSPDGSLWAVYDNGLVLKYNQYENFESQHIPSHVSQNLNAIWGTHDSNIYVAGNEGIILHYDGIEFTRVPTPTDRNLLDIWGSDNGYTVAGGVGNTLIQCADTQSQWKRIKQGLLTDPDIYAIWGTDDHNFFAAGGKKHLSDDSYGVIYYYYGRWEIALEKSNVCFTDIWGKNAAHVQICGFNDNNKGILARYNGYKWTVQDAITDYPLTHLWGVDTKSIIGITLPLSTISTIGYFQNDLWHPFADSPADRLTALTGNTIFNVSVADMSGQIYRFDSQTWNKYPTDFRNHLKAVWGNNDRQLYAVGEHGAILHTDGVTWSQEAGIPDITFKDVFGLSDQHIIIVGNNGIIYAYDGYSWESQSTPTTNDLNGVWGETSDNAFAVGQSGTILHYNGMDWVQMTSPATHDLYDIASTSTDVFAVGRQGIILKFQGDEWEILRQPTDDQQDLLAVWGDPDSDTAYAVGRFGVVLHYSGTWQTIRAFNYQYPHLYSIKAFTKNYIVACGADGNMLIYDGINWIPLPIPTRQDLHAIWGLSDTCMTIVGSYGTIIRYAAPLKLSGPTESSEGDISEITVQIFPETPFHLPIDINIKAYPEDDVIVSSHVKLAAGQRSDNVAIQFNHDSMSDGPHWVDIFAGAAGHQPEIFHIQVMDTDDRQLTLVTPSQVNESDQLTRCHLFIDSPADDNISVRLHSEISEQLGIPDTVVIPKGNKSAQFFVAPVDDFWLDGTQAVPISAMVPGWTVGVSKTILVADNDSKAILLDGPLNVREEVSNPLFEAWIRLAAIPETAFQIDLSVSDPTELSVPNTITVHEGQQVIPLIFQVRDDQIVDGNQHVCLSASAPGWSSSDYTITVEDNEPGKIQFVFENYHVSESELFASIDLQRSDGENGALTVVCQTHSIFSNNDESVAEKDVDYQSVYTSIVFLANEKKKSFSIPIYQDALVEKLESLEIQLMPSPINAHWVGDKSIAQLFIHDDDWQVKWQSPLPQGNTLNAVAAVSDQMMIAVGDKGTIIHWNGTESQIQKQLTSENLNDIFVISGSEIYVVGENEIFLSYDGNDWRRELSFSPFGINCIWASDSDHLFAAGAHGTAFMRENEAWHQIHNDDDNDLIFYDIWGGSKERVFFVGGNLSQGIVYEWDGSSVASMSIPDCKTLHCVWGTDENNVYAAGDGRVILFFDGAQWQIVQQYDDDSRIHDIWGSDDNQIYAVGGNLNGGMLIQKNNNIWQKLEQDFYHWMNGIDGYNNHVMIVGEYGSMASLTIPNTKWNKIVQGQGDLKSIWGRNSNDIYAVGDNQFKHYTNGEWQSIPLPQWHSLNSVHGDDAIVFAVGSDGAVISYDNQMLYSHTINTDISLKDVWGIHGQFYAVGENAVILCYTGSTFQEVRHPLQNENITFFSIWGDSVDHIFVVGENNQILKFNGHEWKKFDGPDTNEAQTIFAIWGNAANDFYIACDQGTIFHFDLEWRELDYKPNATQYDLFSLENKLVSVGDNGIHVLDDNWTHLETVTDNALYGVWATDNYIFAAGCGSTQLLLESPSYSIDRNIKVNKGSNVRDYRAISFVQRFPNNRAEAVIGPCLKAGYDTRLIRFGTYDPISGSYIEYGDNLHIIPGKSYWVLTSVDIPMPVYGVRVRIEESIEINLDYGKDGWNMIAAPNHASYTWKDIQIVAYYDDADRPIDLGTIMPVQKDKYVINDFLEIDHSLISPFLWKWVDGKYKQTAYLDPYEGYWVKVKQSHVRLRFNPEAQLQSGLKRRKVPQRQDIDFPPLPMSGFDDGMSGIGSGCLINNILP
jgi:photosystem II stability/assembly factor-like uncharacterized protein